jgi:hypothetical protein
MKKISIALAALAALVLLSPAWAAEPGPDRGFTHVSPDGNRYTALKANLPESKPLDIRLTGKPVWVIGIEDLWAAVLADGQVQAFRIEDGKARPESIETIGISPDAPPVLVRERNGGAALISSGLTSPMPVSAGTLEAEIKNGRFMLSGKPLRFNPLPDSRILSDGKGRLLVLTGPTRAYSHGVLGDALEATGFVLIELKGKRASLKLSIVKEGVIEGTSPIWADLDGDGLREVILTVSDDETGARISAYNEDGSLKAESLPVGRGYRWRHQIAVAPFGPGGELELASVLTPHIGGTVEFLRQKDERLKPVASVQGYSSHMIGSRNLDMAVAGDLDSDGRVELLVPAEDFKALAALRRTGEGVVEPWRLDLPGKLSTNIAVTGYEGRAVLGVGTDTGVLRLWIP